MKTTEQVLPATLEAFLDRKALESIVKEALNLAKTYGGDAAEVSLSTSVGLNVGVRLNEIETLEFNRDKGLSISVMKGKQQGSASTSDFSTRALAETVAKAAELADITEPDPWAGLADPEMLAKHIRDLDLYHPWAVTVPEAVEMAKAAELAALQFDKRITNSEGASVTSGQGYHIYANSNGFLGGYPTSRHSMSCVVVGGEGDSMERDYEYTSSRLHSALLTPEAIGKKAAEKTLAKLNSRPLPTQVAPIIFEAEVAVGVIRRFLSAISGGALYRKKTFLVDSKGQSIFPEWMEIAEDPFILQGNGSTPFDEEGVEPHASKIVNQGVIERYILGSYSARRLGLRSTGNAGGIHNISVKSNAGSLNELIRTMGHGFLITELMGSGVNLVTGDFSRGAAGFWVENGVIQFPVSEVTIAGNLRDLYRNIKAIGSDYDRRTEVEVGSILVDGVTIAGAG